MGEDIFFTILAIWVIYRIFGSVQIVNARRAANTAEPQKKEGSVSVDYVPPSKKSKHADDDGEYVDYEELK